MKGIEQVDVGFLRMISRGLILQLCSMASKGVQCVVGYCVIAAVDRFTP